LPRFSTMSCGPRASTRFPSEQAAGRRAYTSAALRWEESRPHGRWSSCRNRYECGRRDGAGSVTVEPYRPGIPGARMAAVATCFHRAADCRPSRPVLQGLRQCAHADAFLACEIGDGSCHVQRAMHGACGHATAIYSIRDEPPPCGIERTVTFRYARSGVTVFFALGPRRGRGPPLESASEAETGAAKAMSVGSPAASTTIHLPNRKSADSPIGRKGLGIDAAACHAGGRGFESRQPRHSSSPAGSSRPFSLPGTLFWTSLSRPECLAGLLSGPPG
jgi:hypothetical protein